MASDPSIYGQIGVNVTQLVNPLTQYTQGLQARNALLGFQRDQAQFQGQQAQGAALQGAIRPDGSVDTSKANQALSAGGPSASFGISDALAGNQQLAQAQQNRSAEGQMHLNQGLASLLTLDDSKLNTDAVGGLVNQLQAAGSISASDAKTAQSEIPADGSPSALRGFLTRHLAASLAGPAAMQAIFGTPTTQTNNRQLQPGMTSGALNPHGAGAFTPSGTATTLLTSPETNAQFIDAPDPNHPGATLKIPRSSLPGADGQPVPPIPTPVGLAPGAYRPRGQPAAAPPSNLPAGAVPGSADPNVVASNAADTTAYTQAKSAVPNLVQDTQTLNHSLDALKYLHAATLSSGPGTEAAHRLFAYAASVRLASPNVEENAANYELAKKNLTRYAASQSQSAHTDAGLAANVASNASVDGVGNLAAQTVVKQELGKRNQAIAQVNEAPDPTGRGFNGHASSFAQSTDPRAFAFDSYTPQEQAQIIGGLKPGSPERAKFVKSLVLAHKNGFISPPGAQPAAGPQ